MKLSLTFGKRLMLLALLLILGLALTGGLAAVLGAILKNNVTALMRITAVVQDLLAFIVPAVVTAMLCTRLPADLLQIRRGPGWRALTAACVVAVAAVPVIGSVNELCTMLPWPQSVIDAEAQAQHAVAQLTGAHTAMNLTVSLLILGLLTGVSEELFFRGALQRLLLSRPMSLHAAVWIAAALFSLMHAQPIGFVPRMLLGAMMGYLAAWTGSTWTAVVMHAINNSLVVVTLWLGLPDDFVGLDTPVLTAVSAVVMAAGLAFVSHHRRPA